MMETSSFSDIQQTFPDAEQIPVGGSTCDCYRVRLYGKLHFLKRLKPDLSIDPRFVAALEKEFETGYRLDHPTLVHYVSKGVDYLLMEYVDGETLGQFVAHHPDFFKSRKNTNRLLSQLLDVLGYLHAHQVVHLDLKPDNILITRIGQNVKLADLGYCYTDTYTDTMGRTDKYAAPEQLQGAPVDERTDIYAVGKILESLPCPHIYNKVISHCTESDPQKRYQSAEEMLRALPNSNSSLRWLYLLSILVIGVLVGIALWFRQPTKQSVEESATPHDSIIVEQTADTITIQQDLKAVTPPIKKSLTQPIKRSRLSDDIQAAVKANFEKINALRADTAWWNSNRFSPKADMKCLNIASARELSSKYPDLPPDSIQKAIDDYTIRYLNELSEE